MNREKEIAAAIAALPNYFSEIKKDLLNLMSHDHYRYLIRVYLMGVTNGTNLISDNEWPELVAIKELLR